MIPLSIKSQRAWKDPKGYRFLAAWSNCVLLEILIRKFTSTLVPKNKGIYRNLRDYKGKTTFSSKSPYIPLNSSNIPLNSPNPRPHEYRLKTQLDDAARSTVSNIVEGFKRPTTKEYLEFLGFSQGSLEEVRSDIQRSLQNKLIKSVPESSLLQLGVDLKDWNEWCKNPLNSSKLLYFPLRESYGKLEDIKGEKLTFEIFMELINKTDYLLRNLVASLQKSGDQKENIKKYPWETQEQEADKWLVEIMKNYE